VNPQNDINQQPQPVQRPTIQPQPMQQTNPAIVPPISQPVGQLPVLPVKKSRLLLVVILVVALLLIISSITFALISSKDNDKKSNDSSSDSVSTSESEKPTTDSKVTDADNRAKISSLHLKLEEYFNENYEYPANIATDSSATFPGIDTKILNDETGKPITIIISADKTTAEATADPIADGAHLQYLPYDCDSGSCSSYILRTYIANPTTVYKNPYIKTSLN